MNNFCRFIQVNCLRLVPWRRRKSLKKLAALIGPMGFITTEQELAHTPALENVARRLACVRGVDLGDLG